MEFMIWQSEHVIIKPHFYRPQIMLSGIMEIDVRDQLIMRSF